MNLTELLAGLADEPIVLLSQDDLPALLAEAEALREEDTRFAGSIRVLSMDGRILVQEESPEGRVYIRGFDSREAADAFLEERLTTYERMWDGCGCKVHYDR